MAMPKGFRFSQQSLQDYVDCPRRFQLRYLWLQPWPALMTEPAEEAEAQMQRGADLHRLAHQHSLGLAPESLAATIHDPLLAEWWRTYLAHPPSDLPVAVRRAEVSMAAPLTGTRLLAKVDLLAAEPGHALVIVDWKTAPRTPPRITLARRLQTRVYRWLAVEAGVGFNGGRPVQPDQVEMVYWFATSGGRVERFPYTGEQYETDRTYLAGLVSEVNAHSEGIWPLTHDTQQCRFCNYRSLCERGVRPGLLEELEEDLVKEEAEIDLEQIAEIEF